MLTSIDNFFMKTQAPSSGWWLFRKILPGLIFGCIAGAAIGVLAKHSPALLRCLEVGAAIVFAGMFLLYSSWAAQKQKAGGYVWHPLERAGIFCSGIGALLLSLKLGFPSLPGHILLYLFIAFFFAFVIRPVLDRYGWKLKRMKENPTHH